MLHVVVDRGYCCGRSGHHGNCVQWVSLFTPPPDDKGCNNKHGLQKASVRWRVRRPRNKRHIIQESAREWRAQGEYLERIANGACVLGAWRRSARSTPIFLFRFDPPIFFFSSLLGQRAGRLELDTALALSCHAYPRRRLVYIPSSRTTHVLPTHESECLTDNGNRMLHQIREISNGYKCVDLLPSFLFFVLGFRADNDDRVW